MNHIFINLDNTGDLLDWGNNNALTEKQRLLKIFKTRQTNSIGEVERKLIIIVVYQIRVITV